MWPSWGGCAKTRPCATCRRHGSVANAEVAAGLACMAAFQPGQTRRAQARPANRCLHGLRRGDGQDLYCERLKLSDFSTPKNIGQTKPYKIYKTFLATYAPVGGVSRCKALRQQILRNELTTITHTWLLPQKIIVTVHRGLSQFSRRERRSVSERTLSPRKWDCPPGAVGEGQVHVFGQRFA